MQGNAERKRRSAEKRQWRVEAGVAAIRSAPVVLQWYFQRYVQHLATAGEIVLFDRSWCNRAGAEHVIGFCSQTECEEFLRQVPEFERNLVRSAIHLIKFWFSVSREEQRRRFKERAVHPLKQWKLSPVDLASLDNWDDYIRAKETMFFHTDTADLPWTVVKSDDKKRARLNAVRYVLHAMPYKDKDAQLIGLVDDLLVGRANIIHKREEHIEMGVLRMLHRGDGHAVICLLIETTARISQSADALAATWWNVDKRARLIRHHHSITSRERQTSMPTNSLFCC